MIVQVFPLSLLGWRNCEYTTQDPRESVTQFAHQLVTFGPTKLVCLGVDSEKQSNTKGPPSKLDNSQNSNTESMKHRSTVPPILSNILHCSTRFYFVVSIDKTSILLSRLNFLADTKWWYSGFHFIRIKLCEPTRTKLQVQTCTLSATICFYWSATAFLSTGEAAGRENIIHYSCQSRRDLECSQQYCTLQLRDCNLENFL